jgi:hypothetical protein
VTVDALEGPAPEPAPVRPFIERRFQGMPTQMLPAIVPSVEADGFVGVRAYAITGGRARTTVHLEFETMLQATPSGHFAASSMRFERSQILALAGGQPLSVAELAAHLGLPLGVVRVLAADLLADGHLESFQPSTNVADDVLLITRLIAGVRAL